MFRLVYGKEGPGRERLELARRTSVRMKLTVNVVRILGGKKGKETEGRETVGPGCHGRHIGIQTPLDGSNFPRHEAALSSKGRDLEESRYVGAPPFTEKSRPLYAASNNPP
jgi:hypothetical protein